MNRRRAWIALASLLAVAGGGVAIAEELVTRDGQIIQTQGPWELRGRLLVFKLADGTLASLRLDEADLEASERRAAEKARRERLAREEKMRPPPEPKTAVMVLTDKDVAHAAPDLGEEPEPEGGELAEAAGGAVDSPGRGVQVVQWSQESVGDDGVAVNGVIQNLGSSFATSLSVNALFYDETGALLAAREVQFEEGPLAPGARRDFSVSLPHSLIYDEIRFQVVGRGFRTVGQSARAGSAQPPAGDEETP